MTQDERALCIRVVVALRYGINLSELAGPGSRRELAHARWIAIRLIHDMKAFTLGEIGAMFGDRHHTSILHGVREIERLGEEDPHFQGHWRAVRMAMQKIDS